MRTRERRTCTRYCQGNRQTASGAAEKGPGGLVDYECRRGCRGKREARDGRPQRRGHLAGTSEHLATTAEALLMYILCLLSAVCIYSVQSVDATMRGCWKTEKTKMLRRLRFSSSVSRGYVAFTTFPISPNSALSTNQ